MVMKKTTKHCVTVCLYACLAANVQEGRPTHHRSFFHFRESLHENPPLSLPIKAQQVPDKRPRKQSALAKSLSFRDYTHVTSMQLYLFLTLCMQAPTWI